jgi:hypothetical protein
MMGRLKSEQGQLFYQFNLEDAVPVDHLVRRIDAALDVARSFVGTEGFEKSRRERKKIEMRFAHLKRTLRLDRLRLRGNREAPRMSLFWPPSPRTCDGSPNWSPGRRHMRFSASRSGCVGKR